MHLDHLGVSVVMGKQQDSGTLQHCILLAPVRAALQTADIYQVSKNKPTVFMGTLVYISAGVYI